jgi:hypothetical protein
MSIVKEFLKEEDGLGVVEIILIIVVIIGLVILFQDGIKKLIESIFKTIMDDSKKVSTD